MGKDTPEPVQPIRSVTKRRLAHTDIDVVHEAGKSRISKLTPEQRRLRREDNKMVKQSRKWHRKRKKHGR